MKVVRRSSAEAGALPVSRWTRVLTCRRDRAVDTSATYTPWSSTWWCADAGAVCESPVLSGDRTVARSWVDRARGCGRAAGAAWPMAAGTGGDGGSGRPGPGRWPGMHPRAGAWAPPRSLDRGVDHRPDADPAVITGYKAARKPAPDPQPGAVEHRTGSGPGTGGARLRPPQELARTRQGPQPTRRRRPPWSGSCSSSRTAKFRVDRSSPKSSTTELCGLPSGSDLDWSLRYAGVMRYASQHPSHRRPA